MEPIWLPTFKMATAWRSNNFPKYCYNSKNYKINFIAIVWWKGISIGLKFYFRETSYFEPIWPPKLEIFEKVQNSLKIKITRTHNSICSNLLDMVNHKNTNNVYYICSYNKNGYLFSIWPETGFTNVAKINEIFAVIFI